MKFPEWPPSHQVYGIHSYFPRSCIVCCGWIVHILSAWHGSIKYSCPKSTFLHSHGDLPLSECFELLEALLSFRIPSYSRRDNCVTICSSGICQDASAASNLIIGFLETSLLWRMRSSRPYHQQNKASYTTAYIYLITTEINWLHSIGI